MGAGEKSKSSPSGGSGKTGSKSSPHPPPLIVKGKIFGYEILQPLGQGAASRIYAVLEPATGRSYALKHVIRRTEREERFVDQLKSEFDIGRRVKSPTLRQSIVLQERKRWFSGYKEAVLVLELINGSLLVVPEPDIAKAMLMLNQLGHAVAALHEAGFVHCDLKPHNLLVDNSGHLRLIDLGQTCPVGTIKTRIQGTPEYMAPEQLRCMAVSYKTDVFGWGATAYKLLTGTSLPTLFTTARKQNSFLLDDTIRPPIALAPHVPQELSDLVMSCVKTASDKRPELKDVLAQLAEIQRIHRAANDSGAEQTATSESISA